VEERDKTGATRTVTLKRRKVNEIIDGCGVRHGTLQKWVHPVKKKTPYERKTF